MTKRNHVAGNVMHMINCDQVTDNQIENVRENLVDDNAGRPELEMELKDVKGPPSCRKETFPVNENSFSSNRLAEQDGCQSIDGVKGLDECNASSSVVDHSESQGQSYHYEVS